MDQPDDKITRPNTLKLLCILTFIGSGLSAFSYLVFSLTLDTAREIVQINEFPFQISNVDMELIKKILNLPRYYFVIHFILFFTSLAGAYLMWNLRKVGFHLYAISQIILLILYRIFVPGGQFPVFPLIATIFFILLYAGHLRYMR